MGATEPRDLGDSRSCARGRAELRERRFRLLVALGVGYEVGYVAGAAAGVPTRALALVYVAAVPLVPPLAALAYFRAPPELRRLCAFLVPAATLWLVGTAIWYYHFATAGYRLPPPPGPWDAFYFLAYLVAISAVYVGLREAISLRRAVLDASVLAAILLALGAALIGKGLETKISGESVVTLARPLFGLVMVTLLASATIGARDGLPLSVVIFGIGQIFLTAGSLTYAYEAVQNAFLDNRWADAGWLAGAVALLLAGSVIILGVDRPVQLVRRPDIPGQTLGAKAVLLGALVGLGITVAVAFYGYLDERDPVLMLGLAASAWIGVAMALRARDSIVDVEHAYRRLDRAHLELERAKDRLAEANQELARANVKLRSTHPAFEDVLMLADERTRGGLRAVIEDAGEDLAALLSGYLRRPPP